MKSTVNIEKAARHAPREWFDRSAWKCTYDEYLACYCPDCENKETCKHSGCFRRMPEIDGGLGLCPNLKNGG